MCISVYQSLCVSVLLKSLKELEIICTGVLRVGSCISKALIHFLHLHIPYNHYIIGTIRNLYTSRQLNSGLDSLSCMYLYNMLYQCSVPCVLHVCSVPCVLHVCSVPCVRHVMPHLTACVFHNPVTSYESCY